MATAAAAAATATMMLADLQRAASLFALQRAAADKTQAERRTVAARHKSNGRRHRPKRRLPTKIWPPLASARPQFFASERRRISWHSRTRDMRARPLASVALDLPSGRRIAAAAERVAAVKQKNARLCGAASKRVFGGVQNLFFKQTKLVSFDDVKQCEMRRARGSSPRLTTLDDVPIMSGGGSRAYRRAARQRRRPLAVGFLVARRQVVAIKTRADCCRDEPSLVIESRFLQVAIARALFPLAGDSRRFSQPANCSAKAPAYRSRRRFSFSTRDRGANGRLQRPPPSP